VSAPHRRRERMLPWKLYLDTRTRRNLALRAASHGVTRPDYVRALINGDLPGSKPGTDVALADAWWASRKPARRESIWRNHSTASSIEDASGDQLTIEDAIGGDQ